jgi:membrane associated rhomboid family serine protease
MNTAKNTRRVIWTYVIGAFVIIAYAGMRLQVDAVIIPDSKLEQFGAAYAKDIYDGAFWGVIINSFLHSTFSAFLLNLLFFLYVGRMIEKENGSWFLLLFGLGASIVTSSVELAMSSDPGIGMTGVNFALLGFILLAPDFTWRNPWLRALPWFIVGITLFLCAEQIAKNDYKISVFSLLSGLIYGLLLGLMMRVKWLTYSFQIGLVVMCIVSIMYNPYSSEWNNVRGYHHHIAGNREKAKAYYLKSVELSPDNVAARKNLKKLKIEVLIDKAYDYHSKKKYNKARETYVQILNLDKNNAWAMENLAELP